MVQLIMFTSVQTTPTHCSRRSPAARLMPLGAFSSCGKAQQQQILLLLYASTGRQRDES
jgi:hypothetical protein